MPSYTTTDIRNVILLGHAGSGKTSLAEALLQQAGAIHHRGLVEKGTTTSDYTDEEKARGHSIFLSIMHADHQGRHINLLDTPGYSDFFGQAIAGLPAVDTAIIVVSAIGGIEPGARKMMERATEAKLCRMIVINKIDAENIDLPLLLDNLRETFGKEVLPINLPTSKGTGVIDCFTNTQGDSDLGPVAKAHQALVDQIVEVDEKLMEAYLEQGSVKPEQLMAAFYTALAQGHLIPVCFTSARHHADASKSAGISELLTVIAQLLPDPAHANRLSFHKSDQAKTPVEVLPDPTKNALAHVFNVAIDPFVGKLCAFRIHQGIIKSTSQLFVSDPRAGESKKPFKVAHLFKFQGKEHVEVSQAIPGDIVAVAKVEEIHHSAVLHEHHDSDKLLADIPALPQPMFGLAITAKNRGDEQKLAEVLAKLQEEDRTFKVVRDSSTHETVIYGMGELHLRVILERMKTRNRVEVDTKPPKIGYRETIAAKADGHHRHKKQTGGAGQFGEVYLRVVPLPRGSGFEFVDDTFGGNPPKQYLPAVEKGVRQVLDTGAVAGYPMQDLRVEVYDGKHHDVDSKEVAFITAGKRAFIDAVSKAKPVLLEPCVNIEVSVPSKYVGDIAGDLSGKRGRIQGTDVLPGDMAVVKAVVPLSEVSNYQSQLKSVTGGQGSYTMELSHFDPVPPHVQQQIVAQYKPKVEED